MGGTVFRCNGTHCTYAKLASQPPNGVYLVPDVKDVTTRKTCVVSPGQVMRWNPNEASCVQPKYPYC